MAKGADPESRQVLVGRRLKALRIESGLEVEEIASELEVSAPSWYAYEGGRQAFPYTRLPDVAKALGVSTGHLIERLFPVARPTQSFKSWAGAQIEALASAMVDTRPATGIVPS